MGRKMEDVKIYIGERDIQACECSRTYDFESILNKAVSQAVSSTNNIEYAGLAREDIKQMGGLPYDNLEKMLKAKLKHIRELKNHKHLYDDNDYCVHCGMDGRA